MPVGDLDKHLRGQGFRPSTFNSNGKLIQGADVMGYKTWAYTKDSGPYSTTKASFDSKGGKHVRSVSFNTITDH